MKIIFEGVGDSANRFIYAEYCTANHITIRIEDLADLQMGQEITLISTELEPFVERLKELLEQVKSPK